MLPHRAQIKPLSLCVCVCVCARVCVCVCARARTCPCVEVHASCPRGVVSATSLCGFALRTVPIYTHTEYCWLKRHANSPALARSNIQFIDDTIFY